jgi:hypothetical protein
MAKRRRQQDKAPSRPDDANAFIPDPEDGHPARADDDLAESLGEHFVEAATAGDDNDDAPVDEEMGGPFVVTAADEELAGDTDASNPPDATREPLPRANAAGIEPESGDDQD